MDEGSPLRWTLITTARKVRAFVSGIDTNQDVSSEVFYLEPITAAA
jgi:hypothetical protein